MAGKKRKASEMDGSNTMQSSTSGTSPMQAGRVTRKKPATKENKTKRRVANKSVKQNTPTVSKKRKTKPKAGDEEAHPASTFNPPSNPRATFEGLPAELRLLIYEFLGASTLVHVHKKTSDGKPVRLLEYDEGDTSEPFKFSWTPCRQPNPKAPLLCANPKWSGMCKEQDRCTYKLYAPPEPLGFWALAASNKAIRNEARGYFLRNTVFSVEADDFWSWIRHLEKCFPNQVKHIQWITLAAPDSAFGWGGQQRMMTLRERLPNLKGVGIQCQSPIRNWVLSRLAAFELDVEENAWKRWSVLACGDGWDPSVTIALEAMIWRKKENRIPWDPDVIDEQAVIRVIRKGVKASASDEEKAAPAAWEVEVEKSGPLAEPGRNAKWKAWWRLKELKDFI